MDAQERWGFTMGDLTLPWFIDEGAFRRWPFVLEFLSTGGLDVYMAITAKRGSRRDLLYATYACSTHHGSATALRWVERGLKEFPRSPVLHLERGRWLALLSTTGRWSKAAAVDSWRKGLDLGGVRPEIARRVEREAAWLAGLPPRATCLPDLRGLAALNRKVARALKEDYGLLVAGDEPEFYGRALAGQFLLHYADGWGWYALLSKWYCGRFIVLPAGFPSVSGLRRLLDLLVSRFKKGSWTEEKGTARVRMGNRSFSLGLETPLDTAREFEEVLSKLGSKKRLYEAKPLPEEGARAVMPLDPRERRFFERLGLFSLVQLGR